MDPKECTTCGTTLVEISPHSLNLVNGRVLGRDELICPECWGQCPECDDWYITGHGCPKHEDAELTHPS
jgi:hypothetical protein